MVEIEQPTGQNRKVNLSRQNSIPSENGNKLEKYRQRAKKRDEHEPENYKAAKTPQTPRRATPRNRDKSAPRKPVENNLPDYFYEPEQNGRNPGKGNERKGNGGKRTEEIGNDRYHDYHDHRNMRNKNKKGIHLDINQNDREVIVTPENEVGKNTVPEALTLR